MVLLEEKAVINGLVLYLESTILAAVEIYLHFI